MLGTLVSSCPPHWALARRVSPSVMISLYCVRCAAIQCQLHPDQWGPLSARGRICREDNISEPFSILYAPNVILTFLKLMFIIRLSKIQRPWAWNTPATHTTLPCLSTCLLLTHDVMRWIHLHEDIYKLQENNKEGAAFVSNGTKHYAISVNKIIFLRTTAHHCSIGLWCQIPFEHWYWVQDRGRTWSRIQDQAAGWTLRCPRVPLGCNLDNLTRCWLLEFYQSPQHETRAPASTRDLKWTNGDPFPLRYNV